MSPRPRLASDAAILEATARVIRRVGPNGLTLAEVGREAGVSPATLIQRFGSKRELLLALASGGEEGVAACFDEARRGSGGPLAAVFRVLEDMADMAPTPEELSNHLAFLQMDLGDPGFHRHALAHARATRNGIRALLDEAVERGELEPCDTGRLGRAAEAVAGGALLGWAVHREGTARRQIRDGLETLIGPYRAS